MLDWPAMSPLASYPRPVKLAADELNTDGQITAYKDFDAGDHTYATATASAAL